MRGAPGGSLLTLLALLWVPPAQSVAAQTVNSAKTVPFALVMLSRHGVRAPTQSAATLASWTTATWPAWPVGRGELSPRGAAFARAMGAAYRQRLAVADACPAPSRVALYADLDQRTLATGQALLAGFAPGCGLPVRHHDGAKPDPLFHPLAAGVCTLVPTVAKAALLAQAGGDINVYAKRWQADAALLQQALGPTSERLCQQQGVAAPCTLTTLPSRVKTRWHHGYADVAVAGGLALSSSAVEVLALNRAEFPELAGVPAPALSRMLALHVAAFNLNERTPYLARAKGSALLARLRSTLAHAAHADGPWLSALVGHDTNLANVASLLGASWQGGGWPRDATPPAGALVFELYRASDGGVEVAPTFWQQPLAGLHGTNTRLAPQREPVALRGCAAERCPLDGLLAQMDAALDARCVPVAR